MGSKHALLFACELLCRSSEERADFDHFRIQIPREPRGPLRHLVTRRVDSALHRCRRRCPKRSHQRPSDPAETSGSTSDASGVTTEAPQQTHPASARAYTTRDHYRPWTSRHRVATQTTSRQRRLPTSAPARRRTGGRHDQRESHQRRVPTRAVNFISPTHHPKTGKLTLSNSNRAIYIVTARNRKGFSQ